MITTTMETSLAEQMACFYMALIRRGVDHEAAVKFTLAAFGHEAKS